MNIIWSLSRYVLPVLAVLILVKCIMTLMLGHPKKIIYAHIVDMTLGTNYDLNMWETSIGRSASCDITLPYDSVARSHVVISRRIDGWYIYDLLSKGKLAVNGEKVEEKMTINDGDIITLGDQRFRFEIKNDPVVPVGKKKRRGSKARAQRVQNYDTQPYYNPTKTQAPPQRNNTYSPPVHDFASDNGYTVETAKRNSETVRKNGVPKIINRDTGEKFVLCGNEVSVGSGKKCEIRLKSSTVARLHALIVLYEDGWAIDCVGNNKVLLNGHLVKSAQLLFDGDVIALGDERIYFSL
ncbi:MAG: FHA domain-containing protein [Acutalibacteraceae bacterium]